MRILVAGAEGRTGRQVVDQALGHGHEVAHLAGGRDRSVLVDAVRRAEAVISTLAVDGASGGERAEDVTAELLRAMTREGIARLVVASVAGAGGHRGEVPLLDRGTLFLPSGRDRLAVADIIEGEVMISHLDWTIVRAAALSDRTRTGHYRVVEGPIVPKGAGIPRGDLAAFILKTAESDRYMRRIVSVAR